MDASHFIRDAVRQVALLRQGAANSPQLARAVGEIKRFQARRFAGTYRDLLDSEHYRAAALFFLRELYGEKDYAERDAQFARIAGALERLFPEQVVATAVALAQLHRLSEELDLALAQSWLVQAERPEVQRYVAAWQAVGRRSDRNTQLTGVLEVGRDLERLTRMPGLRLMLKMMRKPAQLAAMGSLQQFLESGFDTFAAMGRSGDGAGYFLDTVKFREDRLMDLLFGANVVACETEIARILGQAR